ncbi:hypothetical protein STEG23_035938, partial [Scotinomys teguina]
MDRAQQRNAVRFRQENHYGKDIQSNYNTVEIKDKTPTGWIEIIINNCKECFSTCKVALYQTRSVCNAVILDMYMPVSVVAAFRLRYNLLKETSSE